MISTIRKESNQILMSLNVLVSDVTGGVLVYEPVTQLMSFGEYSAEAKQDIREKITTLCTEDCLQIIDKFQPSKRMTDTWLFVISMRKAMEESGIEFDNIDVTNINLVACRKQEDTMMVSQGCL